MLRRISLLMALVISLFVGASAQTEMIVVRPEPSDELLVDPGRGITTFQGFNGWYNLGAITITSSAPPVK